MLFILTSRQKRLALRLGSDQGTVRDAWAVLVEVTRCHSPKSNQTISSGPLSPMQGSGPILCPKRLLAELHLFPIKAAA